jgi:TPR repeat protein
MRFADTGLCAPADAAKGTDFCRRAALAGSPLAMNEMGVRYQRGTGLPKDEVAAVGWFALAAQYGLPAALVNLGFCYETGKGAVRDYDLAGRNYALGAKQNFGMAEFRLGMLLEQGLGAAANPAHAQVLYTRAAAHGIEDAKKKSAELKAKLTPAQIEEADKLLKENGASPKSGSNP